MRIPMVNDRSVLVTGCSSGIGRATAELLRSGGWRVFPTARKPEDLEKLRADGFDAVELDISRSDSIQAAVKTVLAANGGQLGALLRNSPGCFSAL